MDGVAGASPNQLNAPYAERWGLLKDVMGRLYIDEKKKVKDIVEIMKADYQFYASETQYKRQFGLWNMRRALPTKKKAKISKALETRAQQGKSSVVLHNGKVEVQKIRRYMKEQARRDISIRTSISNMAIDIENLSGHALQCGNRVFMNWSMPGAVLHFLKSKVVDHISPNASAGTPMSGILVATPSSNAGPSPRNPPSPGDALSPNNERSALAFAVQENLKINRAHLFVQKHHEDLLRGMDLQEQCIITDWMHQFWQYSFTTARTWGRGPRTWNSSSLKFNQFSKGRVESLPGASAIDVNSPEQHFHRQSPQEISPQGSNIRRPSALCRWSIHIREVPYEGVKSPQPAEDLEGMIDPDDEDSWRPWTAPGDIHDFADSLQENIENNDFSTIKARGLPISSIQIARAARRSPEQLLEEAFGFSIMARNRDLVNNMMEHIHQAEDFFLHDLFPFHLASSYLDGSKTCCGLFDDMVQGMPAGEVSVRKLYINHLNHTVLDNFMIAILKAHTSCTPIMVDKAFKKECRFAGEEVDICGRWDADSDCIRHLQASGNPTIPQNWKHMFCHTSAQAITHCIGTLFSPHWGPDINTPSGLFLKRCLNETCGLKLQLKPLHTLVVTAVYLAQLGSDGENLFGMVACLLCLLGKGANPLLKAHISLNALLSSDNSQDCSHSELDPLELAQKVPQELISKWPQERIIGWKIFCAALRLSQNEWRPRPSPEPATSTSKDKFQNIYSAFVEDVGEDTASGGLSLMDADGEDEANKEHENEDEDEYVDNDEDEDTDEDVHEDEGVPAYCTYHYETSYQQNFFGKNKNLSTLWAAVQTELLNYRRIVEGDPWISSNFDMESVLESLEKGGELSIRLVSKKMMRPFCRCGVFCKSEDPACLRVEEASAYYFSNLEDWTRSTFLHAPIDRTEVWDSKY